MTMATPAAPVAAAALMEKRLMLWLTGKSQSVLQTMRGSAAMEITSSSKTITSFHFRRRARYYRLAAVITDAPRDVAMLRDLAWTLDRLSEDFARAEAREHSL